MTSGARPLSNRLRGMSRDLIDTRREHLLPAPCPERAAACCERSLSHWSPRSSSSRECRSSPLRKRRRVALARRRLLHKVSDESDRRARVRQRWGCRSRSLHRSAACMRAHLRDVLAATSPVAAACDALPVADGRRRGSAAGCGTGSRAVSCASVTPSCRTPSVMPRTDHVVPDRRAMATRAQGCRTSRDARPSARSALNPEIPCACSCQARRVRSGGRPCSTEEKPKSRAKEKAPERLFSGAQSDALSRHSRRRALGRERADDVARRRPCRRGHDRRRATAPVEAAGHAAPSDAASADVSAPRADVGVEVERCAGRDAADVGTR